MKKIFIFMFSIFIFMLSLSVKVKAIVDNDYFQELTENFSQNPMDSCTFVATTMLLSYYDTYLNDDIIPEQYDKTSDNFSSSPGVYREEIITQTPSEYVPQLISMKEKSLQGLLMYIASLFGYPIGSIDNYQREQVLIYYFDNYTNFEYGVDYTFVHYNSDTNFSSSDDILNVTKNEIDNARPVIYTYAFGTDPSKPQTDSNYRSSHASIAYAYDENDIYVHLGYDKDKDGNNMSNYSFYALSNYYYTIPTKVFSIIFNIDHKHSNNYVIDDGDSFHLLCCPCGYYTTELHNTIVTENAVVKCSDCNKIFSSNQNFNIMLDPSNASLCGTYVNIFGGNLDSNEIVTGYTRVAYIIGGTGLSRLDCNWYSSNTNICEVTKYGTILAKDIGTAYIIVSSKNEPFKYGVISINVLGDATIEKKYISMTTDIRTPSELNGTEVRLNNGNSNEFTIHTGFTRALCFSLDNAYPSINDFTWQTSNCCLELLPGGYVKANNVDKITEVYVYGYSKYNTNIMAVMTFTVIPNEDCE